MPDEHKVRWAGLRVGIMAIAALVLAGVLIYLLSGTQGFFKSKSDIYVYTDDSADTAKGAPVRLNGILVGSIESVALSGSSQPGRVVKITLNIDNKYLSQIPIDSKAQIAQPNLLGTRYINITRGTSPQTIKPGGELPNAETTELTDLFEQGNTALAALKDILKKMDDVLSAVETGQGTIGKFLVDPTLYNKAVGLVNGGQQLIATLNSNKGTIGKLLNDDQLYDDVRSTVTRVNTLVDGLQQGQGTAGKLLKDPAMYDDARAAIGDLRKTLAQTNQMLADLNAGKGTAGKILKSDELANQLHETLARMDTLLDKINSGQGTIGQLVNNPSLYESLDGTTREAQGLIKDFRANPKKFLRIKLGLF